VQQTKQCSKNQTFQEFLIIKSYFSEIFALNVECKKAADAASLSRAILLK